MKASQCDKIVRHLEIYGRITSAEAMQEYGIYRLASRITDLRRKGVHIVSKTEAGTNRFGEPTRYAVYSLAEEVKQ